MKKKVNSKNNPTSYLTIFAGVFCAILIVFVIITVVYYINPQLLGIDKQPEFSITKDECQNFTKAMFWVPYYAPACSIDLDGRRHEKWKKDNTREVCEEVEVEYDKEKNIFVYDVEIHGRTCARLENGSYEPREECKKGIVGWVTKTVYLKEEWLNGNCEPKCLLGTYCDLDYNPEHEEWCEKTICNNEHYDYQCGDYTIEVIQ